MFNTHDLSKLSIIDQEIHANDISLFFDKNKGEYFAAIAHTCESDDLENGQFAIGSIYNLNRGVYLTDIISRIYAQDKDAYIFCGNIFSAEEIFDTYFVERDVLVLDFDKIRLCKTVQQHKHFSLMAISNKEILENNLYENRISTNSQGVSINFVGCGGEDEEGIEIVGKDNETAYSHIGLFVLKDYVTEEEALFEKAIKFANLLNRNISFLATSLFLYACDYKTTFKALRHDSILIIPGAIKFNMSRMNDVLTAHAHEYDKIATTFTASSQKLVVVENTIATNPVNHHNLGEEKMTTQIQAQDKQPTKPTVAASLVTVARGALDHNKQAAVIVAKIQSGNAAIQIVTNRIAEIVPDQYREMFTAYSATPIGKILIANLLSVLQAQFAQNSDKAAFIAEGAVISAMNDIAQALPLQKMVVDLFSGIQVPNLVEQQ